MGLLCHVVMCCTAQCCGKQQQTHTDTLTHTHIQQHITITHRTISLFLCFSLAHLSPISTRILSHLVSHLITNFVFHVSFLVFFFWRSHKHRHTEADTERNATHNDTHKNPQTRTHTERQYATHYKPTTLSNCND